MKTIRSATSPMLSEFQSNIENLQTQVYKREIFGFDKLEDLKESEPTFFDTDNYSDTICLTDDNKILYFD